MGGAYVRLLDTRGEFTAEVPTTPSGQFRFFALPGAWTVRTHAPGATVDHPVRAQRGAVVELVVAV